MMKQQTFEQRYIQQWDKLDGLIAAHKEKDKESYYSPELPALFREVCHHLALAKQRRYNPELIERLNSLVIETHHLFYRHQQKIKLGWIRFLAWGFPQLVRANKNFVYIATALFVVPLLAMGLTCYFNGDFIYSVASYDQVSSYEAMYDPSRRSIGRERDSETDVMMFGHYIQNNIGISFQIFASGILVGIGTIFYLILNGVVIGGVGGHLTQLDYIETFWGFVAGHGSFELTAIVLSGAAGLKLGYALINPGALSRTDALRTAGRDAIGIIYGTTLMLLIAAFIEAFWSSTSHDIVPVTIKYLVGIALWVLVLSYLCFAGKRYESR